MSNGFNCQCHLRGPSPPADCADWTQHHSCTYEIRWNHTVSKYNLDIFGYIVFGINGPPHHDLRSSCPQNRQVLGCHQKATCSGNLNRTAEYFTWTLSPDSWPFLETKRFRGYTGIRWHQWQYYMILYSMCPAENHSRTGLTTKTRQKRAGQHAIRSAQTSSHSWHRFRNWPKSAKLHVCIKDVAAIMLVHDNVGRMCGSCFQHLHIWLAFTISRMLFSTKNTKEENGWPTDANCIRKMPVLPMCRWNHCERHSSNWTKTSWATPATSTQGFGECS